jgi:hypothetical protein
MLVVQTGISTAAGASLLPLYPMDRPAEDTLEDSGKGHRLESWQMPTCADFRAVCHGDMRPNGDGLPGSH